MPLLILLDAIDDDIPVNVAPPVQHFTETPYFIILVIVIAIIIGILIRLAFTSHNSKEYKYDPNQE